MAAISVVCFSAVCLSRQVGSSVHHFSSKSIGKPRCLRVAPIRATSTTFLETKPAIDHGTDFSENRGVLACPVCYTPFPAADAPYLSMEFISNTRVSCNTCMKSYTGNETHLDMTMASGTGGYGETKALSTEFFRLPLISFLYERGWRQNFFWAGFPGLEKEFEMAKTYLKPVFGGKIIDASCGSGLFSRLFAKSGLFSLVVALDYSENMLRECYDSIKQEENFPIERMSLVRADISRLPFRTSSIEAVHAGAALHCWPSPSSAMAEISRVLWPGGVFVATTYILDGPFSFIPFLRNLRGEIMSVSGSNAFLSERELEDLCKACGLVNFTCVRNGLFVMISAAKPC